MDHEHRIKKAVATWVDEYALSGQRLSADDLLTRLREPEGSSRSSSDFRRELQGAIGARARNYQLLRRIGQGGFGYVWEAIAPNRKRRAVKLIPSPISSCDREAEEQSNKLLRELNHPYICQVIDHIACPDQLIIVMELMDCSLRAKLHQRRTDGARGIPAVELTGYIFDAAQALDYLHDIHRTNGQVLLHRDIKPDNILLIGGHAKVADLGLVRDLLTGGVAGRAGTAAYMSPEQANGRPCPKSDQYSLAATYVELRLGCSPSDEGGYWAKQVGRSDLRRPEQEVLLQALDADMAKRYASCRQFAEALKRAAPTEFFQREYDTEESQDVVAARQRYRLGFDYWVMLQHDAALPLLEDAWNYRDGLPRNCAAEIASSLCDVQLSLGNLPEAIVFGKLGSVNIFSGRA
jgi:serine/threonine protein kinase